MSSELLQQITSIAALLTAAAAFLTILELRRQRTAGYRPALAIEDKPVAVYQPSQNGKTVVFQPLGSIPSRVTLPGSDIFFRVRNVGAGAAIEVNARWEFNAVEFAAAIAKADSEAGQGISVDSEFIRFEAKGYDSWMTRRVREHHLGTLSASPDTSEDNVPIPSAYALLASAFFQAILSGDLGDSLELDLPPLTLCVSFRDRTGSLHESKYLVSFELEFLSRGGGLISESPGWANIGRGIFTVRAT